MGGKGEEVFQTKSRREKTVYTYNVSNNSLDGRRREKNSGMEETQKIGEGKNGIEFLGGGKKNEGGQGV